MRRTLALLPVLLAASACSVSTVQTEEPQRTPVTYEAALGQDDGEVCAQVRDIALLDQMRTEDGNFTEENTDALYAAYESVLSYITIVGISEQIPPNLERAAMPLNVPQRTGDPEADTHAVAERARFMEAGCLLDFEAVTGHQNVARQQ